MKSLLNEMNEKFQEIENKCDCGESGCSECNPEEIEEQNVTSAVAGFNTPAAFAKPGKWKSKSVKYESVNTIDVAEAMDQKYMELIEGYRDFKHGDKKPSHKVKDTIREIAKKLQEIETLVNYNTKLKTEAGISSSQYGPAASKALAKISSRLTKISERVRALGE
jgi:hypothetical protein